jgi:alpha-L-fucosidase
MKTKFRIPSLLLAACLLNLNAANAQTPVPTQAQLEWQQEETNAFIHFTVNTFTDNEWGSGSESPSIFNPTQLDAMQWIKALKDAGIKTAILTAKHHDGFCLWPSKYTEHSVKNSPWKNGKGDVVKEVADACRALGVKFGVYLSPWDRHEKSYGTPAYNDYYKNQLRELLTQYGDIAEVWFDGAKGEKEKDMQYDFEGYWKIVKELQPNAIIYSAIGPGARWVGNEKGIAGDPCWSTINTEGMWPGKADKNHLNTGDKDGKQWIPAEADVSIRPGWFYHAKEDDKVKTPQQLVNLYYQSVGRNSLLLLNVPPNRDGLFCEADIRSLKRFREILDSTFAINLLADKRFRQLADRKLRTYASINEGDSLELPLTGRQTFNRIALQENIAHGQFIESGSIMYWDGSRWQLLQTFTTVGHKRLLKVQDVSTDKIKIIISKTKDGEAAQLSELGLYKAAAGEEK